MDMFLYMDLKTGIHRLDPRTKLLLMFLTFTVGVISKNIIILSATLLLVLLHGAAAKILSNLKRIKVVLLMISLFSLVIWAIAGKGGGERFLIFSLNGLFYGCMTAIRTNLMILAGMVFLSTTKIEEISEGLVKIHLPYRGAFAFSTAIRLVPMIVATSYTIIQAQKSRGLDLDSGNILEKIRKYAPLMIPTLVSVIRGTNVFSMALESKGFGYSEKRTNYLDLKMTWKDLLASCIGVAVVAVVAYIRFDAAAFHSLVSTFPWADYSL
ncbi:energy-coupling factor transporter transmembrane component T family protein [Sediminispirochaeta bajacaliforniensis]|uniref:energy-coupling factor transporter transmembrane component T family protein n=1 Tax=Sediminispirochaeta bajacaliforniensis TaxID=148 RepID=UPI00036C678B|nr:energy-coupling factor transporter transmembrane component T [Sediminispirochaeta bajacaliforniensis]